MLQNELSPLRSFSLTQSHSPFYAASAVPLLSPKCTFSSPESRRRKQNRRKLHFLSRLPWFLLIIQTKKTSSETGPCVKPLESESENSRREAFLYSQRFLHPLTQMMVADFVQCFIDDSENPRLKSKIPWNAKLAPRGNTQKMTGLLRQSGNTALSKYFVVSKSPAFETPLT